jgi:regulator of replication initiation timing
MFENLKPQVEELERELAALKTELVEVKRTLSQVLGENAGLREENDRLIKLGGIAPAFPVRRHSYPHSRF